MDEGEHIQGPPPCPPFPVIAAYKQKNTKPETPKFIHFLIENPEKKKCKI